MSFSVFGWSMPDAGLSLTPQAPENVSGSTPADSAQTETSAIPESVNTEQPAEDQAASSSGKSFSAPAESQKNEIYSSFSEDLDSIKSEGPTKKGILETDNYLQNADEDLNRLQNQSYSTGNGKNEIEDFDEFGIMQANNTQTEEVDYKSSLDQNLLDLFDENSSKEQKTSRLGVSNSSFEDSEVSSQKNLLTSISKKAADPENEGDTATLFRSATSNQENKTSLLREMSVEDGKEATSSLLSSISDDKEASGVFLDVISDNSDPSSEKRQINGLLKNISEDSETSGSFMKVLSKGSNSPEEMGLNGIQPDDESTGAGNFIKSTNQEELKLNENLRDNNTIKTKNFLDSINEDSESSGQFMKVLASGTEKCAGIDNFDSMMEGINSDKETSRAMSSAISKGVETKAGREGVADLMSHIRYSPESQAGLIETIGNGSSEDTINILSKLPDNEKLRNGFIETVSGAAMTEKGLKSTAKVLDNASSSAEGSSNLLKSVELHSNNFDGVYQVGEMYDNISKSPEASSKYLKVESKSLENSDSIRTLSRTYENITDKSEARNSYFRMESEGIGNREGLESVASKMRSLRESPEASASYFRARGADIETEDGLSAMTRTLGVISTDREASTAYFTAQSAVLEASGGREIFSSNIRGIANDPDASKYFMQVMEKSLSSQEGRLALGRMFESMQSDPEIMADFFKIQSASGRNLGEILGASHDGDGLFASYKNLESVFKKVSGDYSSFTGQIERSSNNPAVLREYFSEVSGRISTTEGAENFSRIFTLMSRDSELNAKFFQGLSNIAGTNDGSKTMRGFLDNVRHDDGLSESFGKSMVSLTETNKGLDAFSGLMTSASLKSGSQGAMLSYFSDISADGSGNFKNLMKNVSSSPEAANSMNSMIAGSLSSKEGTANFRKLAGSLSENTESREAFFKAWNTSLSTEEGIGSFKQLLDNTRSNPAARNDMTDLLASLNSTESGRKTYADFMNNISQDQRTNLSYFEQLNKMSIDRKSVGHLEELVKNVGQSQESREAFLSSLYDIADQKKGKLLMSNLLRNDEVSNLINAEKNRSIPTSDVIKNETIINQAKIAQDINLSGMHKKPIVNLLSQQSGQSQTQIKETKISSAYEGLANNTQEMIKIHNAMQKNLAMDPYANVRNLSYAGRVFSVDRMKDLADMRLLGIATASQKERVDKLWVELNRMYPPLDPREIYNESKLRYQLICKNCGNQEDFESGPGAKVCSPCGEDGRQVVMSSSLKFKFRGGYINARPDTVSLSPEAMSMFGKSGFDEDIVNVQTMRVMPKLKDVLAAAANKRYKAS